MELLIVDDGIPSLGHRRQLLSIDDSQKAENEVGIGIVLGGSGPYTNYYSVETGINPDAKPLLTGVVFHDDNHNGKYDIGEGLGGVSISVAGGGSTTTFDSGGYSLEVDPGTYTVTASGGALAAPIVRTVTVGSTNARLNLIPPALSLAVCLGDTANAISHSAEYYTDFVTGVYRQYLKRDPDAPGLSGWVGLLQRGMTDEELEAGFIGSPEYIRNHGGIGEAWVRGLYQDLLGRTPSPQEVTAWMNLLAGGASSYFIAHGFAASAEREALRVAGDYLHYLGRPSAAAETNAWVGLFQHGLDNESVIGGFVGSAEYYHKHGADPRDWLVGAYHDILGRSPDDPSLGAWLAFLQQCS
jgi:hypothetical protein